jgi:hypothetical protein
MGYRYRQQFEGEWVQPRRRGWRMACCDCGLVHRVNFRLRAGKIQLQAYRDNRATAARRRRGKARQPGKAPKK